ncbi:MAG: ATP phosphoribosyltransferase [Spirochaetota bacterium]
MLNDPNKLKFALPSKGRLKEPAIELLHKAGFKFRAKGRNLYSTCTTDDITFIFVRTDDIPVLVDSGVVDAGITGSDLVLEREAKVEQVMPLGFGLCRLCVAVREECDEQNLAFLSGKTVATSFPRVSERYFSENGVENVRVVEMNGSVEIMVALGLADAVVDIVETGDSLRDNNLRIFSEIGLYETVMIAGTDLACDERIIRMRRRIEGILLATQYSILEYNIKKENLGKAEVLTPGYKSPTVSQLEDKNWFAVKVMVKKKDVPLVMDNLEKIGATAVFETEINNCRL